MKFSALSILFIITVFGAFLRFYKLDWGQGLFVHPDEYHIVASVSQLSFQNMHPHFFSYGTGVMYPLYFTKVLLEKILPAINIFILGRFYSALFSTLTIPIVYGISRHFLAKSWSLFAALLVAITPGLIQQAHFATPESELTFFLFGTLFFLLRFFKQKHTPSLMLASIFLGLAMSVKIVALLLSPLIVIAIFTKFFMTKKKLINSLIVSGLALLLTNFAVNPYVFLDYNAWRHSMSYEGGVAMGSLPIFYTKQFINSTPILFQLEKIFPYALGPTLEILGLIGIAFVVIKLVRKRNLSFFLLVLAFFALFIPNSFLFAKWTRFVAPVLPFFPIFTAIFLRTLGTSKAKFASVVAYIVLTTTALWTLAFFSIYTRDDVRIVASDWIESSLPARSSILVEGGNMVDVPLAGNFNRVSLDFYHIDEDPVARQKIIDALYTADYFLVQSRRVFMNHQRIPQLYPKTANFYNKLFAGQLGFTKVKEFHSYPQLAVGSWKLAVADETAEETWSVFDHPVIRVFKKERQLSKEEYQQFL